MKSYIIFYIKPQLSFNKSFILNSFPAEHFLKIKSSGSMLFLYSWCIYLWVKVILVRMTHESLYPMLKTEVFTSVLYSWHCTVLNSYFSLWKLLCLNQRCVNKDCSFFPRFPDSNNHTETILMATLLGQ